MENDHNNSILLLGYDRPIAGREIAAVNVINQLVELLSKAKGDKQIDSYDVVSLTVHGGNLNGFVLIRGNRANLDKLRSSERFDDLAVQAHMVMTGVSVLTGVHGEEVSVRRMKRVEKLVTANFA